MGFLQNLQVRFKVFGAILFVVVAIVLFQLVYFPERQIALLTAAHEGKGLSIARIVSHEVRAGLEFGDRDAVSETLRGVGADADVIMAALYDENGSVFAAYDPSGNANNVRPERAEMASTYSRPGLLRAVAPVVSVGGTRGTLVVDLATRRIEEEAAAIQRATIEIAVGLLLAGFVLAFLFGTLLGRRLEALAKIAERVARGDLTEAPPKDSSRDEIGSLTTSFHTMVMSLRGLQSYVQGVAAGDLSRTTDMPGDLAAALNQMVAAQRQLVQQIADTSVQLNAAASEFLANAQQQERGATEQASAVEETRRAMTALAQSANQIASAAQDVLSNAERSQQNSQVVAERIADLSAQTDRITEVLEVIKGIANKSDLLALNAALEGTKAGEAGRGFSLVASQMQRLAENVMRSVSDIKELTGAVMEATQGTVLATELSTKLADDTTRSARQIALISQQQQSGAQQATGAMDDVSQVALQTAAGSKEIVASATDLIELSRRMQALIGTFRTQDDHDGQGASSTRGELTRQKHSGVDV